MTTHTSKSQGFSIPAGSIIVGKWHQKQYQIIKPLGNGARGSVFLAHSEHGRVALKFGHDNSGVTSEVNVLTRFSKVQGEPLGPSLYDVDDWVNHKGAFSFYAMEYINGTPFLDCIKVRGFEWAPVFMLQLLKDLGRLHREGWVFGDLKPDNLIITGPPLRIRWFDVGGTTAMGRSIKEYTEFFDRGYWEMGSRKAEPSYDLFAAAMIMVNAADGKRFDKGPRPDRQLMAYVTNHVKLAPYRVMLSKAFNGDYTDAAAMHQDMLQELGETHKRDARIHSDGAKTRTKKKRKGWKGPFILAATLFFVYVMYVTLFIM